MLPPCDGLVPLSVTSSISVGAGAAARCPPACLKAKQPPRVTAYVLLVLHPPRDTRLLPPPGRCESGRCDGGVHTCFPSSGAQHSRGAARAQGSRTTNSVFYLFCQSQVIRQFYTSQRDHPKKSVTHLTPHIPFTVLLPTFPVLYFTSPGLFV